MLLVKDSMMEISMLLSFVMTIGDPLTANVFTASEFLINARLNLSLGQIIFFYS